MNDRQARRQEIAEMSVEDAQKDPKLRMEAITFLMENGVIAARNGKGDLSPMMILEMTQAAVRLLGVSDQELGAVTGQMVQDRLDYFLGGGNVN